MPQSFVRCWIHGLWATKNRSPIIRPAIEKLLYDKMKEGFIETGCRTRIINGIPDHVHSLFSLNPNKSLADIIKIVKGASSSWLNGEDLLPDKFAWQGGFTAFSVSESQVERVYNYIKNQKVHHKKMTGEQELDELNRRHGLL